MEIDFWTLVVACQLRLFVVFLCLVNAQTPASLENVVPTVPAPEIPRTIRLSTEWSGEGSRIVPQLLGFQRATIRMIVDGQEISHVDVDDFSTRPRNVEQAAWALGTCDVTVDTIGETKFRPRITGDFTWSESEFVPHTFELIVDGETCPLATSAIELGQRLENDGTLSRLRLSRERPARCDNRGHQPIAKASLSPDGIDHTEVLPLICSFDTQPYVFFHDALDEGAGGAFLPTPETIAIGRALSDFAGRQSLTFNQLIAPKPCWHHAFDLPATGPDRPQHVELRLIATLDIDESGDRPRLTSTLRTRIHIVDAPFRP